MPLNPSGPMSLAGSTAGQSIALELGLSATGTISLNQANVRTLAGVPSGTISLSNFYGKSNTFNYTMTSSTLNGNLRSLVVAAGWNQSTNVTATINGGVYAYSNSTGTPGLTINGSWPGGVTLINNGFINGMGGNGGGCLTNCNGLPGAGGGLALSVSTPVSINNASGTISGGGGGGGGGGAGYCPGDNPTRGGGGGGGGRTGLTNSSGGAGGDGPCTPCPCGSPRGGFPGSPGGAGTVSGAGGGGTTGRGSRGGPGGPGGGWGAAGSGGSNGNFAGFPTRGGSGGGAGAATSGSGSFITWLATGTRNGAIG